MLGQLAIRAIRRPPRAAERLAAEKLIEAELRHRQIAPEEAAVERVQADRAIAGPAQPPDLRFDRHPRQRVIRIEPVVAELALRDAGQDGEFGPHRVGAPARHRQPTAQRRSAADIEAAEQLARDQRRQTARVEERFALHQDDRHGGAAAFDDDRRSGERNLPRLALSTGDRGVDQQHRERAELGGIGKRLAARRQAAQRGRRHA